ncbi:MAG: gamma-glutamyltranspeptidase/glutathione hydrolase [Planctomycetota bacterium]
MNGIFDWRLASSTDLIRYGVRGLRACLYASFLILTWACAALPIGEEQFEEPRPKHGAVVSEHPLATAAGLKVLEDGGNAADAAVATALVLSVVYPQAGGLGGGGFALWVPHGTGSPQALDFREVAPSGLSADSYHVDGEFDAELSKLGHLAVGVPGVPAGLWKLADELGTMPFKELCAPAIALAREGFTVDPWLAHHLRVPQIREQMSDSPAARRVFYPLGKAKEAGTILRRPALADTLERLAERGPAGFYGGLVGQAIANEMLRGGGLITLADLENYEARWRTPLAGWFRGYEIVSMPPPSSGGVVLLQALRILDGFPLDTERQLALEPDAEVASDESGLSAKATHWWIEALRMGFADRAEHLGDPPFATVPLEQLLSSEWIAKRRIEINSMAGTDVQPMPTIAKKSVESAEPSETTHLSVLDAEGNAVSLTTTLNGMFGSGVMVGEIGILLNNEMDDFSILAGIPNAFGLVGSTANSIATGKRPLSSMTPTILRKDGSRVALVIGAPGGPRIISAVFQVIMRLLVQEQSLGDAVRSPRLHQQWRPNWTYFEEGWNDEILADLETRGHEIRHMPSRSSVQAIWLQPDGLPVAVSDPRRGGVSGLTGGELSKPASPPSDPSGIYATPHHR